MAHKMTDKMKVERAKEMLLQALRKRKNEGPSGEMLGYAIGTICNVFALLDADKEDFQAVNFVSTSLWMEVTGIERKDLLPSEAKQLQLGETLGVLNEQTSKNITAKARK